MSQIQSLVVLVSELGSIFTRKRRTKKAELKSSLSRFSVLASARVKFNATLQGGDAQIIPSNAPTGT